MTAHQIAEKLTDIEWLASQLSEGERARLVDGRSDWRDADWQDHCGIVSCESCSGWMDTHSNTLREEHDREGFALRAHLLSKENEHD